MHHYSFFLVHSLFLRISSPLFLFAVILSFDLHLFPHLHSMNLVIISLGSAFHCVHMRFFYPLLIGYSYVIIIPFYSWIHYMSQPSTVHFRAKLHSFWCEYQRKPQFVPLPQSELLAIPFHFKLPFGTKFIHSDAW